MVRDSDPERRDRSPPQTPIRQGRIWRNRRPKYAFASPVNLQPLQAGYTLPRPHHYHPSPRERLEEERRMRHLRDLDHIKQARLDDVLNREQFSQAPPPLRAQAPVYREYT